MKSLNLFARFAVDSLRLVTRGNWMYWTWVGSLLALIGGLESVLGIAAVDPLLDRRTDPDRELRVLGLANIVLGLFGGVPAPQRDHVRVLLAEFMQAGAEAASGVLLVEYGIAAHGGVVG